MSDCKPIKLVNVELFNKIMNKNIATLTEDAAEDVKLGNFDRAASGFTAAGILVMVCNAINGTVH